MRAVVALTLLLGCGSAWAEPPAPEWMEDYGQALTLTKRAQKPLLLVLHKPDDPLGRHQQSLRDDPTTRQLLAPYVLCRVDVSTRYGAKVAEVFQASEFPYTVIINPAGNKQLFKRVGRFAPQQWEEALKQHVDGQPVEASAGRVIDVSKLEWEPYEGKVVLIEFWATWCGPCRAEMPNIKRMYEVWHDQGFEVIGVNLDLDDETAADFIERHGIPWTNVRTAGDPRNHPLIKKFRVNELPALILLDREGRIVTRDAQGPKLGAHLARLLGTASKAKPSQR